MTDNEIIRALECCEEDRCLVGCPRMYFCDTVLECKAALMEHSLALINRQKETIEQLKTALFKCGEDMAEMQETINRQNAEIERLNEILNAYALQYGTAIAKERFLKPARAEAVKKFAERFMEAFTPTMVALFCIGEILVDVSKSHISHNKAIDDIREYLSKAICSRYQLEKTIDNLVKEFTEGEHK